MLRFLYSASIFTVASAAASQAQPTMATEKNDYASPDTWLCRPGRQDACTSDLTTTIVAANGKRTPESWAADPSAPIDCFYVYPTVSQDQAPNSDMIAGDDERNVIRQQFARFASVCRPFAPLYRQVTLPALRAALTANAELELGRGLGYNDVLNAWQHYLTHEKQGRGVVLIGHSQGAMVLTELARTQIDGTPIQSCIISIILLGTNLTVPRGKDVGGSGRDEVYVRPLAATGSVPVSVAGGTEPRWRRGGREAYYWGGDTLFATLISAAPGPTWESGASCTSVSTRASRFTRRTPSRPTAGLCLFGPPPAPLERWCASF